MSNNEMVSVPLDLLCRWRHGGLTARDSAEIQRILDEGVLAAPAETVDVVQADTVEQALTLLDFGLSFALCNMDHGGTRRDVKKAQAHLARVRDLMAAAQPQGEPVTPPAPVAVVLPERKPEPSCMTELDDDREAEIWNACLDEFKRLNPWL